MSTHAAQIFLDDYETDLLDLPGDYDTREWPRESPLWPVQCVCGYTFADTDQWQVFTDRLYRRVDNGKLVTLRDAIPGMMYDAYWFKPYQEWCGPDGLALHVVLPNGRTWHIDGVASNCTMKDGPEHKCWVRHGIPPALTVDKNGFTCAAGAGSIQSYNPDWHGFLSDGILSVNRNPV
jgi:hypothetical protein